MLTESQNDGHAENSISPKNYVLRGGDIIKALRVVDFTKYMYVLSVIIQRLSENG